MKEITGLLTLVLLYILITNIIMTGYYEGSSHIGGKRRGRDGGWEFMRREDGRSGSGAYLFRLPQTVQAYILI